MMAKAFDFRPAGAAGACHVNGRYAGINESLCGAGTYAVADLFGDNGHGQSATNRLDFAEQTSKVGVALRLYSFLERVEVEDERICFNHIDGSLAFAHAVAVVELDCAKIRH